MWKLVNGRLIQTIDQTRSEYKTRISSKLIKELKKMAEENNTHIGYLLENGFENMMKKDEIIFDKKNRPKDRVEFRTTCDKEVITNLRLFAKKNHLNLNDVIEASFASIDTNHVKSANWRYRKEVD
ncbi:rRNA methyltransferase [Psychrobacillus soli]|uniref:rRNA methyltransferase n=1 Tax=Psychrobacillus soli TaxID=1543965 RepID=A0A544TLY5_9BACI|nr:rRNA methyltransferase [Psychrobacillus soli]TQR18463.1 rRNA methyltransferase [Psychrobacillus soli]